MKCPYCSNNKTKVTDKRESGLAIRRRRECLKCGKRFTTYERIEPADIVILKKDGKKEKYSRDKLRTGIEKALEKRPVNLEQINKTIMDIENKIKKLKKVDTRKIGEMVMKKLRKLDKVAYIRFASVYKGFDNIKDFRKELKEVNNG